MIKKICHDILFGCFLTFVAVVFINLICFIWLKYDDDKNIVVDVKGNFIKIYEKELNKNQNLTISKWLTFEELNPFFNKRNHLHLNNRTESLILLCEESSGFIRYKSDKFGYRNDPPLKKYEILFLGDSAIEGFCVNNKNTITSIINANSNLKVFNAGKGATGLSYFAITARKLSKELKPKVIAITLNQALSVNRMIAEMKTFPNILNIETRFTNNDNDWQRIRDFSLLNAYKESYQIESATVSKQKSFLENLKNLLRTTSIHKVKLKLQFNNLFYDGEGIPYCKKIKNNKDLIRKNLQHIVETAKLHKSQIVIFYIPTFLNYMKDIEETFSNKMIVGSNCEFELIKKIINKNKNIKLKDMRYVFNDKPHFEIRNNYFADNHVVLPEVSYIRGHYTEAGFAKMAKEMQKFIEEIN